MGVESFVRDFENMGNLKMVPNTTNVVELNVPLTVDRAVIVGSTLNVTGAAVLASTLAVAGAITATGGIVMNGRTKVVGGRVKVGTTSGWTVGAANNLGSMGTVAASQTASTLIVYVEGLNLGDVITGFTVTASINSAGGTVTLDANLRTLTVVAGASGTDASVGSITQISVVAATAATATKSGLTSTVATGVKHYILLTATTAGSTTIELDTVEVAYTPSAT